MYRSTIHALGIILGMLATVPLTSIAQNTFTPDPIQHYYPSFWNDDVFAERVPAFARRSMATRQLCCIISAVTRQSVKDPLGVVVIRSWVRAE